MAARSGQRATFGRLDVAPNGTNAIPSRVTAWLDARCESDAEQVRLVAEIERLAREHAASDGTRLEVTAESVSGEVAFDPALTERLRSGLTDRLGDVPVIATAAGHDAGILAVGGCPDGDDVRPQPHRRLALAGGARRDGRLPERCRGARRRARHTRLMRLRLEHALLDSGVASDVVVDVEDGWIKSVEFYGNPCVFG